MGTSTVSGKGWVVIPQELRGRYGIKKGDRVHFVDYGGVLALIPSSSQNPIEEARGMLKGEDSLTEALLQSRREEASRE